MTELNEETIRYLSELSRIHCSAQEAPKLLDSLQKTVKYVEQLNEIDCADVPPCSHVIAGMANVMREDIVEEALDTRALLDNAPDQVGGMIRVPAVFSSDPT